MSTGDFATWVFDITDEGFNPAIENIESAEIGLSLTDDEGWLDLFEYALIDIEENLHTWEVDSGEIAFEVQALSGLSEEGKLEITLIALFGDFYFNSATLNAQSPAIPTPEPSTIFLLIAGFTVYLGAMKFKIKPTT